MKNALVVNDTKTYQVGFIILILFCFLRPITMLDFNIRIGGVNLLEIFAISVSYLFLVAIAVNLKHLKIDFVQLTMIFFCFYCLFSIFWGSQIRAITRLVLPFVVFFSVRLFVKNQTQINLLLSIVVIAYTLPLLGSFYQILQGVSVYSVESVTGIERYSGLFKSTRPLANTVFFFSVFFYLKYVIFSPENRYIKYVLVFLLLISVFCLFKAYTRSVILGLFMFWATVLMGINKKTYILIFLIITLSFGFLYQSSIQKFLFKTEEFEFETASSGRSFLWEHNIELFKTYSFDEKFLGRGIGVGSKGVIGKENEIWSSHNDYLHLLMQSGVIGLFLYLFIHLAILKEFLFSKIEKKLKYFYLGFMVSIIFINFVSGIITYQLPTAQLFWMIMGFYYIFAIEPETCMKSD